MEAVTTKIRVFETPATFLIFYLSEGVEWGSMAEMGSNKWVHQALILLTGDKTKLDIIGGL